LLTPRPSSGGPDRFVLTQLVGSSLDGYLWDIDRATGTTSNPRRTGLTTLGDIAYPRRYDSPIYTITSWASSNTSSALYAIDPRTGTTSLIGVTGVEMVYSALAFDPISKALYGFGASRGNEPSAGLFTVDTATGRATVVANVPVPPGDISDYSGMTFDENGKMFMIDNWRNLLVSVDKQTGAMTSQIPLIPPSGIPRAGTRASLLRQLFRFTAPDYPVYLSEGTSPDFSGTYRLYTLNTGSGQLSLIGSLTPAAHGIVGMTEWWYD
jgi:hypothetical protein